MQDLQHLSRGSLIHRMVAVGRRRRRLFYRRRRSTAVDPSYSRHLFDADGGIDATDDLVTGKVVWYQKDHLGSVKRTVIDDVFQQQFDYDPFGNAVADVSNRAVTVVANPLDLAFDAFNKIGATLGSGKAQGSGGLAWVKDPASSMPGVQWTISKEGRARPAAGASAPGTVADGRALYAFGKSDGAIQATLVEADDPAAGSSLANLAPYGVGLVARGGAVTLWIEPMGTGATTRAFRIVALNTAGTYSNVALNATTSKGSILIAGDKVRLSVAGSSVEVWVNDVKAAQGSLTGPAATSTATTWGMTFHNLGQLNAGRRVDGFDNLSIFAKAAAPRFGYTGAEFDPATGLYYMGARYYNPVTGSFTSQDPNPPSWQDMSNLYRYAWNDPIDLSDPTGMGAFKKAGTALSSAFGSAGLGSLIGGAIDAWRKPASAGSSTSLSYAPRNGSGYAINVNSEMDLTQLAAEPYRGSGFAGSVVNSPGFTPARPALPRLDDRPVYGSADAATQAFFGLNHMDGAQVVQQNWATRYQATGVYTTDDVYYTGAWDREQGPVMGPIRTTTHLVTEGYQIDQAYRNGQGVSDRDLAPDSPYVRFRHEGWSSYPSTVLDVTSVVLPVMDTVRAVNGVSATSMSVSVPRSYRLPTSAAERTGPGIFVNQAGFPNPMVEVTRTTPSALIANARAQFNSLRLDATSRANFLRQYSSTPEAQLFFNDAELTRMAAGRVPKAWEVHHMQPLFRGGDNAYDNLIVVPKQWHADNYFDLHFYPEGKNPFGRN